MKGRPLEIVRSVGESNGFEAYRLLYKTLSPTLKARALALLGAIASYPPFTSGSLLEQILRFEDLHTRYRQASGKAIDEQLTSAVLMRSLPLEVKSHATVNLPEDARPEMDIGHRLWRHPQFGPKCYGSGSNWPSERWTQRRQTHLERVQMVLRGQKVASSGHALLLAKAKVIARVKRASKVKAMTATRRALMAKARARAKTALQSKGKEHLITISAVSVVKQGIGSVTVG